ncbi:hypothetical protein BKA56DRAFT_588479 [Ilyonectria sp. MPI-CAGE-AT-0026]|nr:hypothetical protein BKA56DRAFT_588479 [Ilyonectria sp. MPI-CAGE-AT-0026]
MTDRWKLGHCAISPFQDSSLRWLILYPRECTFDFEYYTKKHLPLAEELFGDVLSDWEVLKFGDDQAAPFQVLATLVFTSAKEVEALMQKTNGAKLFEDINKYSDRPPVMMKQPEAIRKRA